MTPKPLNLLQTDQAASGETTHPLLSGQAYTLEHIVSRGQPSPPDSWYDQDRDEWVVLIAGTATLQYEASSQELVAGDALLIPAHLKHRVAEVSHDAVWIALHFDREG